MVQNGTCQEKLTLTKIIMACQKFIEPTLIGVKGVVRE